MRTSFALLLLAAAPAAAHVSLATRARTPLGARRVASAVVPTMVLGELTFVERLIAGSIARTVAQTVLHPLDTLRTRAQAKKRGQAAAPEPLPRTLVRGIIPQVLLAGPAGAVQFATLEFARSQLTPLLPSAAAVNLLAAACGALAASSVRVPQENLKQPVQAGTFPSAYACLQSLLPQGPGRFYRGLQSTVLRDVPWNALSFCFLRLITAGLAGFGCTGPAFDFASGMLGGAIAAVLLTPFDVAKTRLMTQTAEAGVQPYKGAFSTIARVAKEEGPSALMSGVVPRVLYLAPLASIVYSVFDLVKLFILTNMR
ncbi:mitochondrial carrier domain-containing protein [Pavlovales sp. CCMP2436]|nr:mitochondrial carrier domain-containing protein [Pavlovales sp. CCMP2436]